MECPRPPSSSSAENVSNPRSSSVDLCDCPEVVDVLVDVVLVSVNECKREILKVLYYLSERVLGQRDTSEWTKNLRHGSRNCVIRLRWQASLGHEHPLRSYDNGPGGSEEKILHSIISNKCDFYLVTYYIYIFIHIAVVINMIVLMIVKVNIILTVSLLITIL